jgi:type I restriction enzyme S subunit
MSKLQELIKKLCPDGVEFRKLGEVCEFINGFAFKSSLFKDEGLPIIRITNINGVSIDLSDVKFFDSRDYKSNLQSFSVSFGDILIAMSGATTGKIGYYDNEDIAYLNQRVGKFVPNVNVLNNRYLFHFLLSKTSELYIMAGGGAQPNLSSNKLMNELYIPLPPLEVQNEIVRILDTFTSHTAELQAELQARKEQYEYYRNKLLTFDENDERVKWMKLGEIGTFVRGNGLQKKDFTETGVGCIHYGQIYTYYGTSTDTTKSFVPYELAQKLTKVKSGNLVIACTSENIEDVCKAVVWLGEEDIVTGGHACVFAHNEIPKYIAYFFQTEYFFQQKKKYARGAKVIDIKVSDLEKISIPVPPLSEQKRIISILDKFESLVNDLSEGLPAEIAAVQEQYEYYRNKLLTFKRKS